MATKRIAVYAIYLTFLYTRLPLPKEVPEAFRMLPEYLIEDVIEFYLFLVRCGVFRFEFATAKLNGRNHSIETIRVN